MGTFCFVMLTLRNLPLEIGKLLGYMLHRWFSLTHVLVFGDPPQFFQGQKCQFLATLLSRFRIGGLLFHSWEEYQYRQEAQLKLGVANRTKPEVEIWQRPKKSTF